MFETVALVLGATLMAAPASTPIESKPSAEPREVDRGRPVDLRTLLDHARGHSPNVARSEARVSFGAAQIEGARPLLPSNPVLFTGLGMRANRVGASFEAQVQISQPFEIAGERRKRLQAARAATRAREADVDSTWWRIQVAIRAAFREAVVAREALEAQRFAVEFSEEILRAVQVRVKVGEGSPLRLRVVEADLADAKQRLMRARFQYRQACIQMAKLAGWPLDEPIEPRGELLEVIELDGVESVIDRWLADHPAVRAAAAEVEAAQDAWTAAKRDAWPHPALGVYAAREKEPGAEFDSGVGLVTLSIPLPLWRRNQGPRAEAKAALTVAKADLGALKYELAQDLRIQIDAVRVAARRTADYAEQILPRFSENLRLLRRAFELGEVDVLEVFVAQRRFLEQQQRALEVYSEYVDAVRAFELTSGQPLG